MENPEIAIAIIAAGSAIIGAAIPQIITYINNNQMHKLQVSKEYRDRKLKAQEKFILLLIDLKEEIKHRPKSTIGNSGWSTHSANKIEKFSYIHGMWFEDEELTQINELKEYFLSLSKPEFVPESILENAIPKKIESISKTFRKNTKEGFYKESHS